MSTIEQPDLDVIEAIEKVSHALTDPHHWSLRQRTKLKTAIGLMMQATDQLDNIEIGPPAESTWEVQTKT